MMFDQGAQIRFWSKVNKTNGCWLWTASKTWNGYGQFGANGAMFRSHRFSWLLTFGEIPDGKLVLHKCDVRNCVNPEHLFLGTYKINAVDMVNKGRHFTPFTVRKTHCIRGHEMSGDNVYIFKKTRTCKACVKLRNSRRTKCQNQK